MFLRTVSLFTILLNSMITAGHVYVFELSDQERAVFKLFLDDSVSVVYQQNTLTTSNVSNYQDAEVISTFLSQITSEIIDGLPNLKLIVTRSTGYNHIDVAYARKKNIAVAHAPTYSAQAVAEFTFFLILNLSRKINKHNSTFLTDIPGSEHREHAANFDLKGKTLGVIGTGNIGKNVIMMAHGFQMRVLAHSRTEDLRYAQENNFTYVPLEVLLQEADIVTLHVPLSDSTYHLINENTIRHMKKGAYLINTARGEIIDTQALLEALIQKKIAGVGLDVIEYENLMKDLPRVIAARDVLLSNKVANNYILAQMPQVFISPHVAFSTNESRRLLLQETACNIVNFLRGSPRNIVNI